MCDGIYKILVLVPIYANFVKAPDTDEFKADGPYGEIVKTIGRSCIVREPRNLFRAVPSFFRNCSKWVVRA